MVSFYYRKKKRAALRERGNGEFDSSPIADLAFLLLIFFIVTSSFILRQGLFISLPSDSASAVKVKTKRILRIYPDNDSFIYQSKKYQEEDLLTVLKQKKEKVKNPVVLIHMKPKVGYQRLISALSLVKKSGIKKVSIKDI